MKVLLDTHAFLWFIQGDERLGEQARELIELESSRRLVSMVSLWEMAIKASLGRIRIPLPIEHLVAEHVEGNAMEVLDVSVAHLDALMALPMHHRDPFDRLLIAQARSEGAVMLSRDGQLGLYDVETRW